MISRSPEERRFYETRQKALHDEEARLIAAKMEGEQRGCEEGREQGELVGRIRLLQELLGDVESSSQELLSQARSDLDELLLDLQHRLRDRNN